MRGKQDKGGISGKKLRILSNRNPPNVSAETGGKYESNGNRKEDRRTRKGGHSQGDPPHAANQGRRPVIDNLERDIRQKERKFAKTCKVASESSSHRIFAGERKGESGGIYGEFYARRDFYALFAFVRRTWVHKAQKIKMGGDVIFNGTDGPSKSMTTTSRASGNQGDRQLH